LAWPLGALHPASHLALVHVLSQEGNQWQGDILLKDLESADDPSPFRTSAGSAWALDISPDGRWALYAVSSPSSSWSEVFLTRFPSGQGDWQVSIDGSERAGFAPDGSCIYFVESRGQGDLYRVAMKSEADGLLGPPERLARPDPDILPHPIQDPEDGRFLGVLQVGARPGNLVLVQDIRPELERLAK